MAARIGLSSHFHRFLPALFLGLLCLIPGFALAAAYSLPADIGSGPFSVCSGTAPNYACSNDVNLGNNDTLTLTANVNLDINGDFDVGKDVVIDNAGFVFNIVASGDIKVDDRSEVNANLNAANKIEFGKNTLLNGNLVAGGDVKIEDDAVITGAVDSGGKIDIGKRVIISGDISAVDDIKVGDDTAITGNISSDDKIDIGKRVTVTGDLNATGDIKLDEDVIINGDVTTTGKLDIKKRAVVNGTCVPSHPQCTGGPPPGGGSCDTFRDNFTAVSYANQDGSLTWSSDWNEVADDGTPSGGEIRVNSDSLRFRGGLQPATALGSRYIEREADLSSFTSATLSFDYRETGNWEAIDRFEIYASADAGANWSLLQSFSDDQTNSFQPFSVDITAYIASNTRIAFVIKSDNGGEVFYVDNVQIEACVPTVLLDHFRITPQTTAASTCLPNAITIVAEDASNAPIPGYTGTVNISTSSGNGNWSVNDASNVTVPNPDSDDNGLVDYSFLAGDAGDIILDLSNTRAESLTISVTDASAAVTSTSTVIGFSDNVFIITEDPVQVAGRPQAMNIALWTNDGSNCFIDTSYNYNPQNLDASIDRAGVLPGANDPSIAAITIPEGPATASIALDFSGLPGQASFNLDSSDVGQYRLTIADNTNLHSAGVIVGSSNLLTVRPFGIAVTNIEAAPGPTVNPGGTAPNDPVFTVAGGDFSASVAGVLWNALDDTDNDGVLDAGVFADNAVAPGYAWDTSLGVSLAAGSYTPDPGTPGTLNNGSLPVAAFTGGSASVNDLQYTEVGSFTLQASANDYLGVTDADLVGDDIVIGRFRPAGFDVSSITHGDFAEACGVFSYIGQDFGYATAPGFTVRALNALGAPTFQYRDGFNKLASGSVNIAVSIDEGSNGTDGLPLQVSYVADAMSLTKNPDGTTDYVLGADRYRHGPAAPVDFSKYPVSEVDPFDTSIKPEIDLIDDGEVSSSYAADVNEITPAPIRMRFGRLRMSNVHGSELNDLIMPAFTEYFLGGAWIKASDDTCTSIADADLVSAANPAGLSTPSVVFTPFASAGDVNYRFPSPGAGNDGFVDTTTDLNAASHLWLRYDWDVDGDFDDDPSARATFGIFEGDPVQIYIQQIFQ